MVAFLSDRLRSYINRGVAQVGKFSYGDIKFIGDLSKFSIGNYCSVAEGCVVFLGHNHRADWVTTYPFSHIRHFFKYKANEISGHPATNGDVIIGNDVWIGQSVTIMSGVTIGDGAVLGANSLITRDVPPYAIYGGNPAKLIKYRFAPDICERLLRIAWWNWEDKQVAEAIPDLLNSDINSFLDKYDTL